MKAGFVLDSCRNKEIKLGYICTKSINLILQCMNIHYTKKLRIFNILNFFVQCISQTLSLYLDV